jgi:hypothetical protein
VAMRPRHRPCTPAGDDETLLGRIPFELLVESGFEVRHVSVCDNELYVGTLCAGVEYSSKWAQPILARSSPRSCGRGGRPIPCSLKASADSVTDDLRRREIAES